MRRVLVLLSLVALLILAIIASIVLGARDVPLSAVIAAISGDTSSVDASAVSTRIPRAALGVAVGSALAVSGVAMQGVTRNPLADPGILGVLSGASLAVVIGLAFFGQMAQSTGTILLAIIGAAIAAAFVYFVGSLGRGGATPLKLALAGAATSAAISSLISAIILPRSEVMDSYRFWQIGSIGGAEWSTLVRAIPVFAVGLIICMVSAGLLNSLALGDDVAAGLGVNVGAARLGISIGAVILCGVATALAGPIGFVGLIVPHIMRHIVGTDHRWLIPTAALAGASLLLFSDAIGRLLVRPEDLDVGVVMPLLGAPLFIWIVRSRKLRDLS
ncbi:FecCD family ABC transporter permease [Corynebacterium sp. ZY180755]